MEQVPPLTESRNAFQLVADSTQDIITPANALDAVGFAGAIYGLNRIDSGKGVVITAASFLIDVIDGRVARATGTSSSLGEAVDAAGDKVKLAYASAMLWKKDLAPKPLLLGIVAVNAFNSIATAIDRGLPREPVLKASSLGKKAIFLQQLGLGLHVLGSSAEKKAWSASKRLKLAGTVVGYSGVALGVKASYDYKNILKSSYNN